MTRQDAETHVRLVGRKCRGPLILHDELPVYREWLWRAAEARDEVSLSCLHKHLEAIYQEQYGLGKTTVEGFDALLKRCMELVFAHADTVNRGICGFDINDLICAYPFDAEKHEVVCPRCGVDQTFIAPWYPGVDGF